MILLDNKKDLLYIQWHITGVCNLKCKHCYQLTNNRKDLTEKQLYDICDRIEELCAKLNSFIQLSMTGGEPLSSPYLFEILNYIKNKRHINSVLLMTNATLINDNIAFNLSEYSKPIIVQFSLEGPREIHEEIRGKGSFDLAIKGVKKLKEHKIRTACMMTLSKLNYKYIKNVVALLEELNVDIFSADRFIPTSNYEFNTLTLNKFQMKEAFETIKSIFNSGTKLEINTNRPLMVTLNEHNSNKLGAACAAGKVTFTILNDGTLLPCRRLYLPLGNILSEDLNNFWNTNETICRLRNNGYLNNKCRNCVYEYGCGGCRAMAFAVNSDYLGEDPLCWV